MALPSFNNLPAVPTFGGFGALKNTLNQGAKSASVDENKARQLAGLLGDLAGYRIAGQKQLYGDLMQQKSIFGDPQYQRDTLNQAQEEVQRNFDGAEQSLRGSLAARGMLGSGYEGAGYGAIAGTRAASLSEAGRTTRMQLAQLADQERQQKLASMLQVLGLSSPELGQAAGIYGDLGSRARDLAGQQVQLGVQEAGMQQDAYRTQLARAQAQNELAQQQFTNQVTLQQQGQEDRRIKLAEDQLAWTRHTDDERLKLAWAEYDQAKENNDKARQQQAISNIFRIAGTIGGGILGFALGGPAGALTGAGLGSRLGG